MGEKKGRATAREWDRPGVSAPRETGGPGWLFHALVESLPYNLFSKDLQGVFTHANPRYCVTAGRPVEDIVGCTDFELHPEEAARRYREDDRRVVETGEILDDVEEYEPLYGQRFYVRVIKAPIYGEDGHVCGVLGMFWDVTGEKRTEQGLVADVERLLRLVEERDKELDALRRRVQNQEE